MGVNPAIQENDKRMENMSHAAAEEYIANSEKYKLQQEKSPLKFVICGLPHSGTTLLSDLFRQVPGIDAGWEGGVLLRPSPKEFEGFDPYFNNMLKRWGLTREELAEACHAENFDGFYTKLKALSKVLRPGTTDIFDKTPRYLAHLEDCMNRVDVPFIASFKDPRSSDLLSLDAGVRRSRLRRLVPVLPEEVRRLPEGLLPELPKGAGARPGKGCLCVPRITVHGRAREL